MRRCYQIALHGIPQSEWDLHDYMDVVRMWNLSRGAPHSLFLESDSEEMVVRCRREGIVLLTLTHDLRVSQVHGNGLQDLIRVGPSLTTL